MSIRPRAHRAAALIAGGALVASGVSLTGPAPVAHAAGAPAPEATAAATWLASAIGVDGLIPGGGVNGFFYAANLDFGVGLVLTGQESSPALAKITDGVDATVAAYVGDIDDAANAGKVAQAAYFYAMTGGNPAAAGDAGLDLESALEAQVDDETGQLGSSNYAGNQVWAVLALKELGSDEAEPARDFLVSQRGPGASDGWGFGDGSSNPDITSWAVQALAPWSWNRRIDAAIDGGIAYLKSVQTGGGIEDPWLGVNANSTGAAAHAFGVTGHLEEARAAATWIADHQVVALPRCGVTPAHSGAVAYNDAARTAGISDANLDETGPATAQALAGLAYLPVSQPAISTTTGYVAAGSSVSVKVAGLRATQPACVSGGAAPVKVTGGQTVAVKAPSGTANRTLTLTALGVAKSTTLKVLAAKTFAARVVSARVRRGGLQTVTVTGLAPGERFSVRYAGGVVRTGTATSAGGVQTSFRVGQSVGIKGVVVLGQFSNRRGSTTFRVVR